jgi:undecaprenol kinase/diacylglycerol kinase (ATP)
LKGLYTALREEKTLVVQVIIAIVMIVIGTILYHQMQPLDWAILFLLIGIIIGTELLNTAIENLLDIVTFKYNYNIKKIKDISAAATFVLSLSSVIVGLFIFVPHIIAFVKGA